MIDNFNEFRLAYGGRPNLYIPDPQWIVGDERHPFRIGCTLANGAATSSDLTTQDAWYEDVQVRTAFNPADASTTRLRAILTVEAVRVFVMSSVFSALDATVKDDASAQLFILADVGGQSKRIDLRGCIREPAKEFQKTQTTAALADWWLLNGGWARVPGTPITLDLEQNTFSLVSLNSVAYGAAITQCWVEVIGFMAPKGTPGAIPFMPGQCPPSLKNSDGRIVPGVLRNTQDIYEYSAGPQTLSRAPGT